MSNDKAMKRSYVDHKMAHDSDPSESREREISLGFENPFGVMVVTWYAIGAKRVPRLEVFDDGWLALSKSTDLIEELAKHSGENVTPDQFKAILDGLGFEDETDYGRPKQPDAYQFADTSGCSCSTCQAIRKKRRDDTPLDLDKLGD